MFKDLKAWQKSVICGLTVSLVFSIVTIIYEIKVGFSNMFGCGAWIECSGMGFYLLAFLVHFVIYGVGIILIFLLIALLFQKLKKK